MKVLFTIGVSLYKAKGFYQIFVTFITASTVTPLLQALRKYLTPNIDYVTVFLILLLLDVASGLYKHSGLWSKHAKNTLSKDDFFYKLLRKVFAGTIWLILINVVEHVKDGDFSDYFNTFGIGVLIAWLGWSVASNLYVISGNSFPPAWVMKWFKRANEDEDFHPTKREENE